MKNPFKNVFKFAKGEQIAETKKTNGTTVALYDQQATNELIELLTRVPDIDEVLRQNGVPRHRLSVLLYDDEIAQAIETRGDAISGLKLTLEPSEDANSVFVEEQIKPHLRAIVNGAFQARLFGYSVMEAVYKQVEGGKIGLDYIGEKPMQWFTPRPDGELRYFKAGLNSSEGELCDQTFKFFMTRCKPSWNNPYGEALLSRLYWPWFFRQNGWKFWGKFLERFGAPLLIGKSTDSQAMVNALLQAHSQAVMGIDRNDSVEAIGSSSNTGQAFNDYETAVIRRIQKVVLGQTLTSGTDGGSGNRALGTVHNTVRNDKLESDIALVLPTIQRIVNALCILNGFKQIEAIYSTEAGLEEGRAARDKDLYTVGVRFTEGYFTDKYELTPEDFTMSTEPAPVDQNSIDKQNNKKLENNNSKFSQVLHNIFAKRDIMFTPNQQTIEEVGDVALSQAGQPLEEELIKKAIFSAISPQDLEERLMVLFESSDTTTREQFSQTLEKAMIQAQIIGFVHAEKG